VELKQELKAQNLKRYSSLHEDRYAVNRSENYGQTPEYFDYSSNHGALKK